MLKPDLGVKECDRPFGGYCHSGHVVPEPHEPHGKWARDKGQPELPIKFFSVGSSLPGVSGVYCELCLVIASAGKK